MRIDVPPWPHFFECSGIRTLLLSCFLSIITQLTRIYYFLSTVRTSPTIQRNTSSNTHLFHTHTHLSKPSSTLLSVISGNSNFSPVKSKAAQLIDLAVTAIGSCSSHQRNIIDLRQWADQTLCLLAMMLGSARTAKLRTSLRTWSSTAYRAVTTKAAQAHTRSLHMYIRPITTFSTPQLTTATTTSGTATNAAPTTRTGTRSNAPCAALRYQINRECIACRWPTRLVERASRQRVSGSV